MVSYWELLEGQYKRGKDAEGEKSINDRNEGEEDVIIEDTSAELGTTSSKRAYQNVKHVHIKPDKQNHVLGDSKTCRGISLTFEDELTSTMVTLDTTTIPNSHQAQREKL